MDIATLPITALKGVGPKLKEKLEQRLGPAVSRLAPAASMAEWFQKNLPPGD